MTLHYLSFNGTLSPSVMLATKGALFGAPELSLETKKSLDYKTPSRIVKNQAAIKLSHKCNG